MIKASIMLREVIRLAIRVVLACLLCAFFFGEVYAGGIIIHPLNLSFGIANIYIGRPISVAKDIYIASPADTLGEGTLRVQLPSKLENCEGFSLPAARVSVSCISMNDARLDKSVAISVKDVPCVLRVRIDIEPFDKPGVYSGAMLLECNGVNERVPLQLEVPKWAAVRPGVSSIICRPLGKTAMSVYDSPDVTMSSELPVVEVASNASWYLTVETRHGFTQTSLGVESSISPNDAELLVTATAYVDPVCKDGCVLLDGKNVVIARGRGTGDADSGWVPVIIRTIVNNIRNYRAGDYLAEMKFGCVVD